ncbi:hypothetical protein BDV93DRAFT_582504 [Ceratobasidium sp. AG-I]|nr:hypothetical protein BDV93DRAFT_582504 [Ceratobasidium sp. AG-I]
MDLTSKLKDAPGWRDGVEKFMVDFANPSFDRCPRYTACLHWGESFIQHPNCCIVHNNDEFGHEWEVESRAQDSKERIAGVRRPLIGPRANKNSYRALNKKFMIPVVLRMLREWRLRTWPTVTDRCGPYDPAEMFISDRLLEHLCKRMHVCTSLENFRQVMQHWDRLDKWGEVLYSVVEVTLQSTKKMWKSLNIRPEDSDSDTDLDDLAASLFKGKEAAKNTTSNLDTKEKNKNRGPHQNLLEGQFLNEKGVGKSILFIPICRALTIGKRARGINKK